MRLLHSGNFTFLGTLRLRTALESLFESVLHTTLAHPLDGWKTHFQRLADALIRPARSLLTLISFEQNTRMGLLPCWGLSC